MRIEQLMKLDLHTVKPHDSVAHARAVLEEHRINQLPVVVNRKLVGIVTDRDLRNAPAVVDVAAKAAAGSHKAPEPPDPDKIPVDAVMTTNVLTLEPGDGVEDAARLMKRERIGAVPIVERGALIGIIARSDLLGAFITLCEERAKERISR